MNKIYKSLRNFGGKKFKQFKDIKILVIGDVMLDHYVYGSVTRISPEAPVPVVLKSDDKFYLGGAGNVFSNIISLGGDSNLLSVVGEDSNGETIHSLIKNQISDKRDLLFRTTTRKTTTKTRIMSGHHQMLRIDDETTDPIECEIESGVISEIDAIISQYDCVILEDYNKGFLTPLVIKHAIEKCRSLSIPVIVDPKKNNIEYYAGATIIKPNFSEFCSLVQKSIDPSDFKSITKCANEFRKKFNIEALVITMSENGIYFSSDDIDMHSEGFKINVSDVSGAGDTVLAILSLCYTANTPIESMLEICNLAGSIACSKIGAVSVTLDEIINHPVMVEKTNPIKRFITY